ncbi:MAG: bifunctional [glutamate--ammonia ligase]-adenylyl-L-tyrosine phosphorylase/[glutamate--ammonia-ligase] adenylyltransferase [Burkholderiales bacterium]|nr:bifunctional [glutamate--ammonia ligase]-adenylyl-L-tyrosine phosphorylase/[glutamate--ammonia-ligase] adenylyltransferase [Burkholderiales bacterium]
MGAIISRANNDLSAYPRVVQRLRRRYAQELALLPTGAPTLEHLETGFNRLASTHEPAVALRILRQLVFERLVVMDCCEQADLSSITHAMTDLAEFSLDIAFSQAESQLAKRHGKPQLFDGEAATLWIVGMGKLGARELNVSSDIDLIYVYDEDGETTGAMDAQGNALGTGRISHHEYFAKIVKAMQSMIGEVTEHGCVFRVDLALRPNGNSGPVVISRQALEEYFLVQGREWERFAWLKSRVVAPRSAVSRAVALRETVYPFVFRRYLDYSVFDALRGLHQQIRQYSAMRHAGRPERANDIKLARGGIREIEFTVQLLQVVRGGQFPELRTRATSDALVRLQNAGVMTAQTAQALENAYVFLRRVEHRIQYLDDQQTHSLPTDQADLAWIAQTLGLADASVFLAQLQTHRDTVAIEFERLLGGSGEGEQTSPQTNASQGVTPANNTWPTAFFDLSGLMPHLQEKLRERVATWVELPAVRGMREDALQRLIKLLQRTQLWLEESRISEEAALRWCDWIAPMLRRDGHVALLVERPRVHEQLVRLLGLARWPARYLMRHPGVIDELATDALLLERFDPRAFDRELALRLHALTSTHEDDEESLLNVLRRAHHAEVFRTLARDVQGRLSVEEVADDLSALADSVLHIACHWVWQRMKQRHRETPQIAILAYGKLGGKELGYGSDLDIVFVYDDPHESAGEIYAVFVRKLIHWLSVKTSEGDLYEIDTALRPNGNSGLLVTTLEAFTDYQAQRGSNTAWTWEHQAMTRARSCYGEIFLREKLEAVRVEVINAPRDHGALRDEIMAMRHKLSAARPVKPDLFDVKHSPGGMVDVEFAVQYLVLAYAHKHSELLANVGNIQLLERCEQAGLLPSGVGLAAGNAYRALRKVQHQARLDELATQISLTEAHVWREDILKLWRTVFGL